jgi:hypothetical protein
MVNVVSLREKLIGIFYRAATGSRKMQNILTPADIAFPFGLIVLFTSNGKAISLI